MILDRGICSIFRKEDQAMSGEKPRPGYAFIGQSWYGELSFETSPARPTEGRTVQKTDARARIHQRREIRQHDVCVLYPLTDWTERDPDAPVYRITRAFHGWDEESAEEITDLTLEVYKA